MDVLYYDVADIEENEIIPLGISQETNVRQIVFGCGSLVEAYGDGNVQIINRRPTELVGYRCENVVKDGDNVIWTVNGDDTAFSGRGHVQLRWYVNGALKESFMIQTYIRPSITSITDLPEEVKSALDLIMKYVEENTIDIDDLDERIANYFDENPIHAPVTSVNGLTGDVVITPELLEVYTQDEVDDLAYGAYPYDTASGSVASFPDGAEVPVKDLVIGIEPVQAGSGDPSPDNIRPISGWTGVRVTHCGKNLLENNVSTTISSLGEITVTRNSDGTLTINGTATSLRVVAPNIAIDRCSTTKQNDEKKHLPNGIFYVSTGCSLSFQIYGTNSSGTNDMHLLFKGNEGTVTIDDEYKYNWVRLLATAGTYENEVVKPIICLAVETDKSYEPYNGSSTTISWSDEAGTVYGGTLDLTTGVLTVTHIIRDMGSLSFSYQTGLGGYLYANIGAKKAGDFNIICSAYKTTVANTVATMSDYEIKGDATGNRIYIKDPNYTDVEAFVNDMSEQTICFELATPITYQLTAQEMYSFLGYNNIFCDTGDTTVVYRADPTLYIRRLTGADDDMVADHNITSGSYFVVNNNLYLATSAIASGEAIVEGTNCTKTDLAEALNALNA